MIWGLHAVSEGQKHQVRSPEAWRHAGPRVFSSLGRLEDPRRVSRLLNVCAAKMYTSAQRRSI